MKLKPEQKFSIADKNHIEALNLFNEKTDKLLSLSFVKSINDPNAGFSFTGQRINDGTFEVKSQRQGPSQEAIDAFVLTFRFFIQDNESSSFSNIASTYETLNIDQQYRKRFESARVAINQLLDSPNLLSINYDGKTPTNREIMNVFIYGGLAHASHDKQLVFKEWMSFPLGAVLFETCFTALLGHILTAINFIANLNKEVIVKVKKES